MNKILPVILMFFLVSLCVKLLNNIIYDFEEMIDSYREISNFILLKRIAWLLLKTFFVTICIVIILLVILIILKNLI